MAEIALRPGLFKGRFPTGRDLITSLNEELAKEEAVRVQDGSVVFNPKYMTLDRFYLAELNNEPYLYRKVSESEVEIYGLAEQT